MKSVIKAHFEDDRITAVGDKTEVDVVFDGSITLWRSGTNLDVVLVLFEKLQCIELVVFNPSKNLEAPRVYIDVPTLGRHLPREEMQKKVEERKELFVRRHKEYVASVIEKEVEMTIMSNYIVSRIALKDTDPAEPFQISLQAHFGDTITTEDGPTEGTTTVHLDFVVPRPEGLIPIRTVHHAKPDSELFQQWRVQFEDNTRSIEANFAKALRMLHVATLVVDALQHNRTYKADNLVRRRWKVAIRRVIHIISCDKTRNFLLERDRHALSRRPLQPSVQSPHEAHHDARPPIKIPVKYLHRLHATSHHHPHVAHSLYESHLHVSKEQRHAKATQSHSTPHILQRPSPASCHKLNGSDNDSDATKSVTTSLHPYDLAPTPYPSVKLEGLQPRPSLRRLGKSRSSDANHSTVEREVGVRSISATLPTLFPDSSATEDTKGRQRFPGFLGMLNHKSDATCGDKFIGGLEDSLRLTRERRQHQYHASRPLASIPTLSAVQTDASHGDSSLFRSGFSGGAFGGLHLADDGHELPRVPDATSIQRSLVSVAASHRSSSIEK